MCEVVRDRLERIVPLDTPLLEKMQYSDTDTEQIALSDGGGGGGGVNK